MEQYLPKEYESDPLKCKIGVIGNLPFSVSTACVIKWVKQASKREGAFAFGRAQCVLAFQAEVADRIVAKRNTKVIYYYNYIHIGSKVKIIFILGI